MHLLIIDHSVLAYKAFLRLFSQDYAGETNDEVHEFTRQYVSEVVYLNEVHRPDGILWVMDCPRDEIWRHKIIRNFYGPRVNAYPIEWMPGTENRNARNACRWYVECHNTYREVWTLSSGEFTSKNLKKADWLAWESQYVDPEDKAAGPIGMPEKLTHKRTIKQMLQCLRLAYKGTREGQHWPGSAEMTKDLWKERSRKLAYQLAHAFKGKIAYADQLEADDLAYAACCRWAKHDITTATIDMDWPQLALHQGVHGKGKHRCWNINKYEFEDTDRKVVSANLARKIMEGDNSDNIKSARLKGKLGGIGEKKADKLMDEMGETGRLDWMAEHLDEDTFNKNCELILLDRMPMDMKMRAATALVESHKLEPKECSLEDLASESTIHMAKIDGQKKRQELLMKKEIK